MIDLLSASYLAAGADPKVIVVPDPDTVSPGFLGFVVVFLLAIATVVLIRSMVTHIRKVSRLGEPDDQAGSNTGAPRGNSGQQAGPKASGTA